MIIVTFLDAVATVDILRASDSDLKLVETRTVHFSRLKSLFRFEQMNKLDRYNSYWQIFAPWNTTWDCFYPINPKARAKMTGITNKVYFSSDEWTPRLIKSKSNAKFLGVNEVYYGYFVENYQHYFFVFSLNVFFVFIIHVMGPQWLVLLTQSRSHYIMEPC